MESNVREVNEVFESLFVEPENKTCFDCHTDIQQAPYASVNNGILLCNKCADLHKLLGPSVSTIKCKTGDVWTHKQAETLLNGGNPRLRLLFQSLHIPKDMPIEQKYRTKAAFYYRDMLCAIVDGNPLPKSPGVEEGREVLSLKDEELRREGILTTEEDPIAKGLKVLSNAMEKAADMTKTAAHAVEEKIKETINKEELTRVKDQVVQKSSEIKETVVTKGSELKDQVVNKSVEVGKAIAEQTKNVAHETANLATKGIDMAKKGVEQAVGFVKEKTGYEEVSTQDKDVLPNPRVTEEVKPIK